MYTYKAVAYYIKRTRHSPEFPQMDGWTFLGVTRTTPDREKEATYGGNGTGLATIVESLHTFLQGATEKGEIEPTFTVKLFQHVSVEEGAPAAPAKKKGWFSSLF